MKKFLSVLFATAILAGPLTACLPAKALGDLLVQVGDDFMVQEEDDNEEEEDVLCTVCQDNCQNGQIVTTTECGHKFHEDCLLAWFEHSDTCPNCRRQIIRQAVASRITLVGIIWYGHIVNNELYWDFQEETLHRQELETPGTLRIPYIDPPMRETWQDGGLLWAARTEIRDEQAGDMPEPAEIGNYLRF